MLAKRFDETLPAGSEGRVSSSHSDCRNSPTLDNVAGRFQPSAAASSIARRAARSHRSSPERFGFPSGTPSGRSCPGPLRLKAFIVDDDREAELRGSLSVGKRRRYGGSVDSTTHPRLPFWQSRRRRRWGLLPRQRHDSSAALPPALLSSIRIRTPFSPSRRRPDFSILIVRSGSVTSANREFALLKASRNGALAIKSRMPSSTTSTMSSPRGYTYTVVTCVRWRPFSRSAT